MLQITDLFVIKSACVNFLEQEPTIYNQKKTLLNGWSTDNIQLKMGILWSNPWMIGQSRCQIITVTGNDIAIEYFLWPNAPFILVYICRHKI